MIKFQPKMTIEKYSVLALRTAGDLGLEKDRLHAVLGITSEAGEIANAIKKNVAYGKELDVANLAEEIGDCVWFLNLMISTLGLTWDQILSANIAKLEKRYPNFAFDAGHALNRDKDAEKEALQQNLGL